MLLVQSLAVHCRSEPLLREHHSKRRSVPVLHLSIGIPELLHLLHRYRRLRRVRYHCIPVLSRDRHRLLAPPQHIQNRCRPCHSTALCRAKTSSAKNLLPPRFSYQPPPPQMEEAYSDFFRRTPDAEAHYIGRAANGGEYFVVSR